MLETLSSSEEESTTPSSIAQSNIELRKRALPLQKWSRKQDYSLPIPAADSSSPVLASTPQPVSEKQISAIQPTLKKHSLQPSQRMVALETPILGDVTNQLDEAILPSRCQLRDPSHFHVANIANKDVSEEVKQNYTANDELNTTSRSVARHDPAIHDKIRSIRQKGYVDVETKLVEQLRNAIAHLDLADIELQRKARDLEEAYVKFRDDVREFEEEKETEKERVLRLRRQLERERKLLNKDGAERDKAIAEQKISSLRLQLRKSEESEQAKEKDLENSNKRIERLERNVNTLQRQLAQIRGNYAKQSREMAAELQAARTHNLRRKQSIGLLQCTNGEITNREAAVVDSLQDPEKVVSREKSAQERSKSVTWADKDVPGYTLTPIPLCEKDCNELVM
ncbi:hypothetical protein DICVIV_07665 [Dictyocaulus viviparus]|uniref:Uncharacterized protein n=1 Tax=Dictyocaulus viviparus TaxID=29172 RepID=A0A0D8XR89_DICVI|nr:hypothetical protein DICVIV_07665 [Dictyocaulus viviparus]